MSDKYYTKDSLTALVVGCGSIGKRHAKNLANLGVDISVFDVDHSRRKGLAKEVNGIAYNSLGEALQSPPDMAIIATPSNHHIEPALAVVDAGCDLFVEKPLSSNHERVEELLTMIKERNPVTMIGSNWRFHPAITAIKRLVDENAVGNVVSARIEAGSFLPEWHPNENYREMYSAKAGVGGALLDYVHEVNYARWLFAEADQVTAMIGDNSSLEIETEDTAAIIVRFENDVICEIHVDYVQRSYSRSCQIIGENGTIRWEYDWSSVRRYDPDKNEWVVEESWEDDWEMNQMYIDEMEHFLHCVQNEVETRSTLFDGYHDLLVVLGAKESASSSRHVDL